MWEDGQARGHLTAREGMNSLAVQGHGERHPMGDRATATSAETMAGGKLSARFPDDFRDMYSRRNEIN